MNATKPDRRSTRPEASEPANTQIARAEAELQAALETPLLPARRRPLRTWLRSIRQLLVCGEFISPIGGPRAKDSSPALMAGEICLRRRVV